MLTPCSSRRGSYHSIIGPHTVHHADGHGEGPASGGDKVAGDSGGHPNFKTTLSDLHTSPVGGLSLGTRVMALSPRREGVFKHLKPAVTSANRGLRANLIQREVQTTPGGRL